MADICRIAIEFVNSSDRWSHEVEPYGRRTLWYGMLCHSFVMLDQLFRGVTEELLMATGIEHSKIQTTAPRGVSGATMGQCLTLLTQFSRKIEQVAAGALVDRWRRRRIMTKEDTIVWRDIIRCRNALVHNGPGYLDSVDLFAGRSFSGRQQMSEEGRAELAETVWTNGGRLCESEAVVLAVLYQGMTREFFTNQLRPARVDVRRAPSATELRATIATINAFHGSLS